jgi:thiol-disulfide isomerase/thioredoxin
MKSINLAALGLAFTLVLAACSGAATSGDSPSAAPTTAAAPVPGSQDAAPDIEFIYFDGAQGTFADYAGTPLVVNFWASWCPSCVAEMAAAFRPVQEDIGGDVAFLGLNLQDERAAALAMVEDTGVLFDLAEDLQGDLYIALGGIGMPFTVFIDADGNVVESHNGPLNQEQLTDMIEKAFGT